MAYWPKILTALSRIALLLAIFLHVSPSCAQTIPGFITIDCGSNATTSTDSQTGLVWESDKNYTLTGMNGVVEHPDAVNSSLDNFQALASFRYFPQLRSKHCYELPMTTSKISFLLRATFLHGNSSQLNLPINFDVYINSTRWTTVQFDHGDDLMKPKVHEGVFFTPAGGNFTYVCLAPVRGIPFISSLELRQLDPEGIMYSQSFLDRPQLFFTNLIRWNTGAPAGAPTVRYPDDNYDRFWIHPGPIVRCGSIHDSMPTNRSTDPSVNNVPHKVMMDAWKGAGQELNIVVDIPFPEVVGFVYSIFYFEAPGEDSEHDSAGPVMTVNLDGVKGHPFNVLNTPTAEGYFHVLTSNSTYVHIQSNSPNPPLVNAMEFYKSDIYDPIMVYSPDGAVINFLKTTFNMTDWQGDPCMPVPYNWINCTDLGYSRKGTKSIASIELSTLQNSGRLVNSPNELSALVSMSITNSNIDAETFQYIVENFTDGERLEILDLSHNNIYSFPSTNTWKNHSALTSLSVSCNHLSAVPSIAGLPFSEKLQILNISNNNFTGGFPDSSSFTNLSSLQILDISSNHLTGVFPSDFYFFQLPSLQNLNADYNSITGVLNLTILTIWYQKYSQSSSANFDRPTINQLFSFVNNSISGIYPDVKTLQPMINDLMYKTLDFNQSGILLGGNPYCDESDDSDDSDSFTDSDDSDSFTQRYLCRSSVNDIVHGDGAKAKKSAFVIAFSVGGIFLYLFCVILSVIIWVLWSEVSSLKEIQQELANRKVQPPFYSYSDLKLATKDFHQSNKLGSGAFGTVHKGVLPDGTTVAVKRLFNSQKKQVLHEFLNEVVLITGIKHKNLVQLKGCCIKDRERILVYEYAERGNLLEAIWGNDNDQVLDWEDRLNICTGIARGLSYLHEELQPRIIHRDIKPANVLLDKNLNSKIADFGLAKPFLEEDNEADFTHFAGTRGYFAPEYVLEGQLTTKADVFSFGILVLEIVSGRQCIDRSQPPDQVYLKKWAEKLQKRRRLLDLLQSVLRTKCPETQVVKVINIALKCVQNDPQRRPTMSRVGTMLLGVTEDKLHTINSNKHVENLELDMDTVHADADVNYEVDINASTSEYGCMKFGRSNVLEESEKSPMIHTDCKSEALVWSKFSVGNSARREDFVTI